MSALNLDAIEARLGELTTPAFDAAQWRADARMLLAVLRLHHNVLREIEHLTDFGASSESCPMCREGSPHHKSWCRIYIALKSITDQGSRDKRESA